jgi:tRNA(Ile)-lysidine synthase
MFLLHQLASTLRLDLAVGHVDHGISGDSAAWAGSVEALAVDLGLPVAVRRLGLGPGASETRSRRARYHALRQLQRELGAGYLVTAHHADDQAETVLYRLLRGSGPAGLAGIPAVGPAGLVRPLLTFPRRELESWLAGRWPSVSVVRDPANEDPAHDRSWLREVMLPLVRQRFPDVDRRLLAAQRQAESERAAWESLVVADAALDARPRRDGVEVARAPLAKYDKALSVALLRAVCRLAGHHLGLRRAERLARLARAAPSGRRLDLGAGWTAETIFDRLRISGPPSNRVDRPVLVELGAVERGEAWWDGWCITWRPGRAGASPRGGLVTWVTPGALAVRAAERGERVRPLGGVGTRPVRRLLMEARVPRPERAVYPVVVRGGLPVWIPGICRSDAALPQPGDPALRLDARRIRDP